MKRGSGFLIGFAAAALTFGTLFATVGSDKFGGCSNHWKEHCGGGHHQCGGGQHHSCHGGTEQPQE